MGGGGQTLAEPGFGWAFAEELEADRETGSFEVSNQGW